MIKINQYQQNYKMDDIKKNNQIVLAKEQLVASKYAEEAIKKYNIDKNKPMPTKM